MTVKNIEKRFNFFRTMLAIIIALGITFVIISFVSEDPIDALKSFLLGPLQSMRRMGNVVEMAMPLILTGLGICVMFQAGQFNLAGEGSFFLGAVISAVIAINLPLPTFLHPLVILIASGMIGAIFCMIPAFMKLKWNAYELVSSLMLNYVALFIGLFIIKNYLIDPQAGFFASFSFESTAILPKIVPKTRIHLGLIIVVACVILCYQLLYRSRWGYSIRITGMNHSFAKYTGIGVASVVLYSQAIGGFISGLAGGIEMIGMYSRFQYQALPQYGFDGIIIATLANNKPQWVPFAALFLAYVRIGADILSRTTDVPVEIVSIIQAIVVVFVAAKLFLNKYKQRAIVKLTEQKALTEVK